MLQRGLLLPEGLDHPVRRQPVRHHGLACSSSGGRRYAWLRRDADELGRGCRQVSSRVPVGFRNVHCGLRRGVLPAPTRPEGDGADAPVCVLLPATASQAAMAPVAVRPECVGNELGCVP